MIPVYQQYDSNINGIDNNVSINSIRIMVEILLFPSNPGVNQSSSEKVLEY